MDEARLASLRAELSELDRTLLEMLARRTQLSLDIGREKQRLGRGTRDFAREKVVLDAARQQAERFGLPTHLVERIVILLIETSLSAQEKDRVALTARGDGLAALVIGGAGKMGRWFVTFLAAQGYNVIVMDPAGHVPNTTQSTHWSDLTERIDLVVVATPLKLSNTVLQDLAASPLPHAPLIFDIASLKSPLQEGLTALKQAGQRVTSIHPMFGPDTDLLSGQHIAFCDVGVPEATHAARALFDDTMAGQVEVDLQTHDQLMAVVLGLSHALNLSFNEALMHSGVELSTLNGLASTTFAAQLAVSRRVASENPALYYEIQHENPYGQAALQSLRAAVQSLEDASQATTPDKFYEMMRASERWLDAP